MSEKVTIKNIATVRQGELNLFQIYKRAEAKPNATVQEITTATSDLRDWQLLYFGYTNFHKPITAGIYEQALAIEVQKLGLVGAGAP